MSILIVKGGIYVYFGSVRFFKHLILAAAAAMIIVPTILCIHYGLAYYSLRQELASERPGSVPGSAGDPKAPGGLLSNPVAHCGFNLVYAAGGESGNPRASDLLSYQNKYPNLYVDNDFQYTIPDEKTVYLTFDDGPSSLTPHVLDVLKEYDVKATFFIVYKDSETAKDLYRRMVDEGHTIAVHSTSHIYKEIYRSVDTYLADFAQTAQLLESATGVRPELFRFPGGSINAYNRSVYMPIIAEMSRRGYTYYDWNVGSGDTAHNKTARTICENVINGCAAHHESIVLMHDLASHDSTLAALPEIIHTLKESGYAFAALDKDVQPAAFGYPD